MRQLFIDMNSFFASVEQQENPHLRGKPLIVAPLLTDSTCAIAASYEAKALGISTGTPVKTAKRICPQITVLEARPDVYVDYHREIVETLNEFFVAIKVLSVDEMACRVSSVCRTREEEERLGREVKKRLNERVGTMMKCSVGVGDNVFLAKVASETKKPDGLTIWRDGEAAQGLRRLSLLDLPGIGSRMATRLEQHGIRTTRQLMERDVIALRRAWGSVAGARWWFMLRGSQEADYGMYERDERKSVGHSHVLPPEFRTQVGAEQILVRLLSKALKRLRGYGQSATGIELQITYRHRDTFEKREWRVGSRKHLPANEETTWLPIVRGLLQKGKGLSHAKTQRREEVPFPARPGCWKPIGAAIRLGGLIHCRDMNLSLFEDPIERTYLWNVVDAINATKGYVLDIASVYGLREEASQRISFGGEVLSVEKECGKCRRGEGSPGNGLIEFPLRKAQSESTGE